MSKCVTLNSVKNTDLRVHLCRIYADLSLIDPRRLVHKSIKRSRYGDHSKHNWSRVEDGPRPESMTRGNALYVGFRLGREVVVPAGCVQLLSGQCYHRVD